MANRQAQVVILSEDRQSEVFVRRFLISIGFEARKIRANTGPSGRNGEQFVRETYPKELHDYRKKCKHIALWLLIVTDADTLSVDERRRRLSASLSLAEEPESEPSESVAILIPCRNIETWIFYLLGEKVDESTEYRHLDRAGDCQPAVDKLVAWYRSGWPIPVDCPDSLRRAIEELKRIL